MSAIKCGTHAIVSAALGNWSTGEQTLVPQLLPDLEPDMLIFADRGFHSYRLWHEIIDTGAAVVFRVSSTLVLPVLETFPDGSYRSVLLENTAKPDPQVGQAQRRLGRVLVRNWNTVSRR